jgi:hypothetical protein
MARHLKVVEQGFARKNKHELSAILKKLTAESEGAVEKLVFLMMKSGDEKLQLLAASKILDMQREIARDINNDQLQRIIGNVKFGGPRQLSTEEEDDMPQIDFSQVQDV